MPRKISKYIKYTEEELEKYKNAEGSCVKKMVANLHLNTFPSGLKNFKTSLLALLSSRKVGSYDETMEGIILAIHNVKLLGDSGGIRFDDPKIHLDVVSDCYVFKPTIGATVRGTVRHVSSSQIGVIIYRVFSVSIRLINKPTVKLEVNSEIEFRIKKFDLGHDYPYIEGELIISENSEKKLKRPKVESIDVEESENVQEVIDLIHEIKEELNETPPPSTPSKPKKRKKDKTLKTEE